MPAAPRWLMPGGGGGGTVGGGGEGNGRRGGGRGGASLPPSRYPQQQQHQDQQRQGVVDHDHHEPIDINDTYEVIRMVTRNGNEGSGSGSGYGYAAGNGSVGEPGVRSSMSNEGSSSSTTTTTTGVAGHHLTSITTTLSAGTGYASEADSQAPLVPHHDHHHSSSFTTTTASTATTSSPANTPPSSSDLTHHSKQRQQVTIEESSSPRHPRRQHPPSSSSDEAIDKKAAYRHDAVPDITLDSIPLPSQPFSAAEGANITTTGAAQKGSRRRRLFGDPVSTITSSIGAGLPGKKRRKAKKEGRQQQQQLGGRTAAAATTTTAATTDVSNDSLSSSNGMVTVKAVSSKHSAQDSTIDQELGYNDGRGSEGVLRRVYDTWALTSLATANIGPIAGAFFGVHTAKEYGGYGMLAIGWPLSGLFMCLLSAVTAEQASSFPVAGAMFTWTFRLCRLSPTLRPLARFLSWMNGSFLLCGHILAQMLVEWQLAIQFQGLIIVYAPSYDPTTWRTILFAWAGLLLSGCVASSRLGRSPLLWKAVSVLMLCTVIVIVGCLFGYAKNTNSASVIFTSYQNTTGFTSKGLVYLVGWVLTSLATGQDVAAHLAEESKYPTRTVPRAYFWSTALSYAIGWIVMLTLMAVSPVYTGISDVPSKDYGAPAQLLTESLPRPVAFFVLLLIVVGMQFQDIAQLLASSRFIWALARDSALPFSTYFQKLSKSTKIPVRSTWAVCMVAAPPMLLILINRAISTTLILSGCGTSLFLAYAMPVACYLTCPNGALDTDGRNEWTLRRWSKPLAWIAMTYVGLIVILMCVPKDLPVTATSFSYASPIIVLVALLSAITWIMYGNAHYAGPIKNITVYTIGREVTLPKSSHSNSTNKPSAKPSTPNSNPQNGTSEVVGRRGQTTTDFEPGKTANIFSESIASIEWGQNPAHNGHSHFTSTFGGGGVGDDSQLRTDMTGVTDTQATGMSEDESWSGSEGDEYTGSESETGSEEEEDGGVPRSRASQPRQPATSPTERPTSSHHSQQPANAPQNANVPIRRPPIARTNVSSRSR